MSRFRFRLERVLGVRRIEESVARADWLESERATGLIEEQARELNSSVAACRAHLAQLQSSPRLDPADVLLQQTLIDRLREQFVQKTIQASRARRETERMRQSMIERRVRVRGLETLETRSKETWRLENEAAANAQLDERTGISRIGATHENERRAPRGRSEKS